MEGETIVRHGLRDDLHRSAITPGLTSRRKVLILLSGNDARPADVLIRRRDTAYDVTVINPLQRATVDRAAVIPGHALGVAKLLDHVT